MSEPPRDVLEAAGIDPAATELLPWRVPIWKVRRGVTTAVLRRTQVDELCTSEDLRWQHQVQSACLSRGLSVPRPLPAFDGDTVMTHQGYVWELLAYLPGETLGWRSVVAVRHVGAALARFHAACAELTTTGQRPNALPLSQLAERVDLGVIDASLPDSEARTLFRRRLDNSAADIAVLGTQYDRGLIHGDFTTLNLLVDGRPPRISGILDFNNAYVETPLADLGFGLWQAGRPAHPIYELDPRRVSDIVAGYCSVDPIPSSMAAALVGAIRARGLQLMVRSSLRGARDLRSPLHLIDWISRHRGALEAAAAAMLCANR